MFTTLTAAMIFGGLMQVNDGGAAFTATTDTVTNIINQFLLLKELLM